jgi:CDP-diacylglycerol---serine O-phosphatidyltransferase
MELMPRPRRSGGIPRPDMRRVVIVMPSAFTLGNLFFGFWSIVSAFNGNFRWAGWFIVFAGILDMLDGRVARLSNTNSKFGAELDSLIDVISFGVAPALLVYFLDFAAGGRFAWVLCYIYVCAVALRLARYNVLAATKSGTPGWFTGLPSPSAGMTLAVFYPFSQTEWYRASLAYFDLQHQGLVVLLLLLSVLMVSNVKYPRFPPIGFRSARGLFGLAVHLVILIGGLLAPDAFLFPLGLAYITFGVVRALVLGLMERGDAEHAEDMPVGPTEVASVESTPAGRERRRLWGERRQERRQEPTE